LAQGAELLLHLLHLPPALHLIPALHAVHLPSALHVVHLTTSLHLICSMHLPSPTVHLLLLRRRRLLLLLRHERLRLCLKPGTPPPQD
jgi:hypothetical protein